ncbi:MAG: LysR family transcriptional regulator [Planctomycetota bacterium]|nr:MAG: LysR family transcriptional regulator [Planctomycetota bacterium]
MIQVHRLEGFYWVARTGGFARAARAFPYPITQPAVHQQVKKLEGELGVTLFERVGKGEMALTPAGLRLYEFVRPFYEGMAGVVRSLQGGDYGGELSIRTASLLLRHLLPDWIKRLQERHPGIRVQLEETLKPDVEALRHGEVDLLVDYLPQPPKDVAVMRVATLLPFLVISRDHPQAHRKRPSLAGLEGDTFIAYTPGLLARELQMDALARRGIEPQKILAASTSEAILGLVESGLGYSLVPSLDPRGPRGRELVVTALSSPKAEYPVVAAWRKDAPENPILDAALEAAPRPV